MSVNNLPLWAQDYNLFVKSWNLIMKKSEPYASIINELSLNISNKFPYFYNSSKCIDLVASCRRLYWIIGEEIDYEKMINNPLSYFISSIPKSVKSNKILSRLGNNIGSIPGTKRLILIHCALVDERFPLVPLVIFDKECDSVEHANYLSVEKCSINFVSLLSTSRLIKLMRSSYQDEYLFIERSRVTIISKREAKNKSFKDYPRRVASNSRGLLDLYISVTSIEVGGSIISAEVGGSIISAEANDPITSVNINDSITIVGADGSTIFIGANGFVNSVKPKEIVKPDIIHKSNSVDLIRLKEVSSETEKIITPVELALPTINKSSLSKVLILQSIEDIEKRIERIELFHENYIEIIESQYNDAVKEEDANETKRTKILLDIAYRQKIKEISKLEVKLEEAKRLQI